LPSEPGRVRPLKRLVSDGEIHHRKNRISDVGKRQFPMSKTIIGKHLFRMPEFDISTKKSPMPESDISI
jgi:hypothetical protein